jgi:hypothetical protein
VSEKKRVTTEFLAIICQVGYEHSDQFIHTEAERAAAALAGNELSEGIFTRIVRRVLKRA